MKKLIFCIVSIVLYGSFSGAVSAQKLSEKFPEQIKAIIAAVKLDASKLKGEKVSEGEYKSKLLLDGFTVFYYEPDDDDPHVMGRRAVETSKSSTLMDEIAAVLRKIPGYTLKDSWKDKDYFTGYRETTKRKLVLLKGEESVLSVIEQTGYTGGHVEIWF